MDRGRDEKATDGVNNLKTKTHLIKPHIIPKVRIEIQPLISPIRRPPPTHIAPKDMYDPMLDLLSDVREVHEVSRAGGTLYLEIVTVILVETLQGLNEEEVDREPCTIKQHSGRSVTNGKNNGRKEERHSQIGPLQFEFPPNIPDLLSPGQ